MMGERWMEVGGERWWVRCGWVVGLVVVVVAA